MMRASSGARRLYAISTRPASTAAGATFKDSLLFSTELTLHRQRPARSSEATGRVVSHGSTAKMANGRFTVVGPWCGLSTLSIRTLGYALGRSGSARRTSPGFLAVLTLYWERSVATLRPQNGTFRGLRRPVPCPNTTKRKDPRYGSLSRRFLRRTWALTL